VLVRDASAMVVGVLVLCRAATAATAIAAAS